jgi:hypothetical protein
VKYFSTVSQPSYLLSDGQLDFRRLLDGFAVFWCQSSDLLPPATAYDRESLQLVIMSYMQRIDSVGGLVSRDHAVGRGRVDLMICKPYAGSAGERLLQQEVVQLKIWHEDRYDPLAEGLSEFDGYLDHLSLGTGSTLVIFDCRLDAAPITERTAFTEARTPAGRTITLLRA